MDTSESAVRTEDKKLARGMTLHQEMFGLRPESTLSARTLPSSASFLNFIQWATPGGFCHLRHGWNVFAGSGIMELQRPGGGCAETHVVVAEELREGMLWWSKVLEPRPTKSLRFADRGGFAAHPRLRGLRDTALSIGLDAACAIFTDAAGSRGWGASLGNSYAQGIWSKVALREGINWIELRVSKEALSHWCSDVRRELVLVGMDNATSVAYANYGAGRSTRLAKLFREIKGRGVAADCAVAAFRIAGKDNTIADALCHFPIHSRIASCGPSFARWRLNVVGRWTSIRHQAIRASTLGGPATIRPRVPPLKVRYRWVRCGGSRVWIL